MDKVVVTVPVYLPPGETRARERNRATKVLVIQTPYVALVPRMNFLNVAFVLEDGDHEGDG
jgi:hypothetical protein